MNIRIVLLTSAFLLSSAHSIVALANDGITIRPGKGMVATEVKKIHEVFVQAINNSLVTNIKAGTSPTESSSQATRQRGTTYSQADLDNVQVKITAATVGKIEYIYPDPENPRANKRLTVYSRSGRSIQSILADAKGDDVGSRPRLPSIGDSSDSGLGSDSGESGTPRSKDVQRDIVEDKYYPRRDGYLRATNQEFENSVLAADPIVRDADAEIKAFRTLERSIQANTIPRGGTVKGFLSQKPCESCARVIEDFSAAYGVKGDIRYLVKPDEETALIEEAKRSGKNPDAIAEEVALIKESKEVSTKTFKERKQYSKYILTKKKTWTTMTATREPSLGEIARKPYVPGSEAPESAKCP